MRARLWRTAAAVAVAAVTLSVTLPAGAGPIGRQGSDVDDQVIGGQPVTSNQTFPFMVAMLRAGVSDPYQAQFCGASLITPRWILTAAHCVTSSTGAVLSPSFFKVALHRIDLSSIKSTDRRRLDRVRVHPLFNPRTLTYDAALVRLAHPVSTRVGIPIRLNVNGAYPIEMQNATILGWGAVNRTNGFPNRLRFATVQNNNLANCGLYPPGQVVKATMICAARPYPNGGSVDTCVGDSGGPLFITPNGTRLLAGITSWGQGCASAGYPGIYSRVSAFVPWIRNVLNL